MSDFPIHQSARDLSVLETPFCHVHNNECTDMYGCTDVDMYIMYAQLLQPTLATEADTYIQYVRLLRPTQLHGHH